MFPDAMNAVEIAAPGDADQLQMTRRPVPVPRHDEILIRVAYAGVNRPDVLQRQGSYAPPPDASDLPGLEASGEIVGMGAGVTRWKKGETVCALLPGGGYAEYVACHADHALRVPAGLSLREAACLPETAFTVWSNVVTRGGLRGGERFLVHGGTSGIGMMAIQIARALGARVFATAGSDRKCAAIEALGATAINYRNEDFTKRLAPEGGADLILDMVGGSYIPRNIKALANDGRLVMIAFLEGPKVELNFAQIMVKRLTVTGSTLRPQSDVAKAEIAEALRKQLWPLIVGGAIKVSIDSEFALDAAAEAHRRMESSDHIGKIVLKVAGG
ncbi:NAD(P)H-quinone oxidoreductase [Paracoccus sp. R12_1]|uniref:NAD(P)H-quinone oxidoreductase n=1 Tax=unclassified Paracoccus (in: a-proteobacteria) TaxID=2688777 RepID=UPI000C094E0B|nr:MULTISPECIES: NAD(P)H-quinone oxidoreductase [unclassified Paracoccus (in: a-proteobacteria)]MBO9456723.1 NAD(P)H-quinone oxidoreductase [Paracoccus sp. R12_2]MBO9487819.1 NAD(P)H-quinone oxidoreductase [Paracoccus sp. R12_1]PHQ67842.1 MAG: NAD(P)H-quinone oxidoreductase [Paracoccus sp. (in: a-proteobacteria)]